MTGVVGRLRGKWRSDFLKWAGRYGPKSGRPRSAEGREEDGDVDVLAWRASGEVESIECKCLYLARTVAEVSESLCLPGRSEKIREVVCRFGAHVPIRAVWLARAADLAVRRRPGARVIRGTSASSNRTARSAGCVVNWRAPPATGTDGSVAANASRSNSTRRGGPAADRQPPLPRTGRKVAAGVPGGGLAHATVGRAAGRARNRSTRPSRRWRRRRVRTAAARLK